MINRVKIDATLPPCCTDYLCEIEPDVPDDGLGKFLESAHCAGLMKMSSDVAHRHLDALAEESRERDLKFAKRFDTSPADSKILQTAAKPSSPTRIEKTIFPLSQTCVCAEISNASGEVLRTWTEKLEA